MLFSIYIVQTVYLSIEFKCEKNENKQKEAGIGPFFRVTSRRSVIRFGKINFATLAINLKSLAIFKGFSTYFGKHLPVGNF